VVDAWIPPTVTDVVAVGDDVARVSVVVAVAELYPLSPQYAAVIVFPPLASPAALPLIVRVAVAVPDVPARVAIPRVVPPAENVTVPVGVALAAPVTNAVRVEFPDAVKLAGEADTVTVGAPLETSEPCCQPVARLKISIEPSPVTRS
jgi:hypothetical protein